MTIYWPNYYKNFHCKADSCNHTCCAGWVIGIDEKSLKRFEGDPEVASKISDGRCPFLRDDNLCEMILKHGEDYLCDICKEHPRFYNDCNDHTEAGIGLVCEEACRLVLEADAPFELVADDGSKMELPDYIKAVFDTSKPFTERLSALSGGRRANSKIRAEIFDEMEVMDPKWTKLLSRIIEAPVPEEDENIAILENEGAGRFAAESVYLLSDLIVKGCGLLDVARVFSCEVEYSDINIDQALETFA